MTNGTFAAAPILVITGPTASGKSSLALEVALRLNGEIVSADAYAIYRDLDIGTDKPGREERNRIPHHLIDVVEPGQGYSAGEFVLAADRAIDGILSRGKTVIVAGGTQFYIQALVFGLFKSPDRDADLRSRLEKAWEEDRGGLFNRLQEVDPEACAKIGRNDRQRVLRALEVFEATGTPISSHWELHEKNPRYSALFTAQQRSREELYDRIDQRVDRMFGMGFVEEVEAVRGSGVADDSAALKAIGYREITTYLNGGCTLEEAIEGTKRSSRKYAKRQISWLRGKSKGVIHWVAPTEQGGASQISTLWADHLRSTGPNSNSSNHRSPAASR